VGSRLFQACRLENAAEARVATVGIVGRIDLGGVEATRREAAACHTGDRGVQVPDRELDIDDAFDAGLSLALQLGENGPGARALAALGMSPRKLGAGVRVAGGQLGRAARRGEGVLAAPLDGVDPVGTKSGPYSFGDSS
jgi:hypothetical protein